MCVTPTRSSAAEDGRAGVLVGRGHRVVDVDEDAGVGGLVGAGKGHLVGRVGAAAARHAELGARDVELGAALALGHVQRDVLGAEQVVAGLDALGDLDVERALACQGGTSRVSQLCP